MSKLKKVLLMCTAYVLVAALAIGGTIAYLQDSDSDVNVMTLGNVSIEQIEQERDANGNLVPFTQSKPVYPAVYEGTSIPYADPANYPVPNDDAWKVVEDNENVVDKFITVKNTGKTDAFVRTLIAFEVGKDAVNDPYMHLVCNGSNGVSCIWATENGEEFVIEISGGYYKVCVFTYAEALAPGKTTIPSVKQVYLDKTATNEVCAAYGETFEILAITQAVQAAGFDDAAAALNTGFGEVTAANAAEWFDAIIPKVVDEGTYGGIYWTLTESGKLTVSPASTPAPDANSGAAYEVGSWREAVVYKADGSASAIGGYPYDVNAVTSLVIEEGVTSIGSFTAKFPNLTGEVVIPASVTYIGQEAFQNCPITKLTFAEGGTEPLCIAPGAFKKLAIEELVLPADRPEIHIHCWAFNDCVNLKSVILPANVTKFMSWTHVDYCGMDFVDYTGANEYDSQVFARCNALESITFGSQEVHDLFFNGYGNRSNINAIGSVEIIVKN